MNVLKNITIAFTFLIAGCDLDSGEKSPKGISEDLSHLKGEISEPSMTNLNFVDGREILINSQISGSFGAIGNSHTFTYKPHDNKFVSISIKDASGSVEHIQVYVTNPKLSNDETVISSLTYTANTFFVTAGQTYHVNVFTDNGGSYTVKLAEANRETMNLAKDEFFVSLVRIGERQCNGSTTTYKSQNLNYTFNFRHAFYVDNLNQKIQLDLIDEYTIGQSRESVGEGSTPLEGRYEYTSESDHWFTLNFITGGVSGEIRQETIRYFDDSSLEAEVCITSSRFEGQILL